MKRYVVDASVAIKWYIPEIHEQPALRLFQAFQQGDFRLEAPVLFLNEIANILWKRTRQQEMETSHAIRVFDRVLLAAVSIHESGPVLPLALAIACEHGISAYDGTYIALAVSLGCAVVTADAKLFRLIHNTHLANTIQWIEDVQ